MAVTKDIPAPYAPGSVIVDLVERHRNRGLPSPVDSEVLGRAGVSDSLIPRTLQTLQLLELVNEDGKPTETFEGIRQAPESEYKTRLAEWLKDVYRDVFAFVDPASDDETAVRDAFRSYRPVGQQPRMVSLFLGLCSAAGLAPEKPTQPRKRARAVTPAAVKRTTPRRQNRGGATNISSQGVPASLAGLLASLPPEGGTWTHAERDKFVKTFRVVLDFCFTTIEGAENVEAPDQEEGG